MNLGRLEKIADLREVWKTEAQDFTPWLANEDNLTLLGETIHINLELEAVEKYVGPFRADILCRNTDDDSLVLVENQVERTDHTHLGQLMTYAAGLETASIVWIAKAFTDEHRAALDWLNEITGENFNFFGLEIELWKIGDSAIAPKFNVVSKPNNWTKGKSAASGSINRGDLTATQELQLEYWKSFADFLSEQKTDLRINKARPSNWMSFGTARSRAVFHGYIYVKEKKIYVELYLRNTCERHGIFNSLQLEKEEIEGEIGCSLTWKENPEKSTSYIYMEESVEDPNDRDKWNEQHTWMMENLEKFKRSFEKRIRKMNFDELQVEE